MSAIGPQADMDYEKGSAGLCAITVNQLDTAVRKGDSCSEDMKGASIKKETEALKTEQEAGN